MTQSTARVHPTGNDTRPNTGPSVAPNADAPGGITPFLPDWVVPLQPTGGGRPVFVFHSAHDEALALAKDARIAACVGQDHPFWAFRRDDPQCERVRAVGLVAMTDGYLAQMRAIQPTGPYLLYGDCIGGYYAWEMARQLLAASEEVAGLLFYEVPIRADIAHPVEALNRRSRRLARYYRPAPLPVDLTLLVTENWHERGWSAAWRHLTRGALETVVIPGETRAAFDDREERIARHVRDWIGQAEARMRRA